MNAHPQRHSGPRGRARGTSLIESLVAILVCAFGLLGFVGLQTRSVSAEFEAFQRSQALVLLEDMVARLNANRGDAAAYLRAQPIGAGPVADCSAVGGAARDVCEWANLLRGSAETRGARQVGAMVSARGCITRQPGSSDRYAVAVVWQGMVGTGAPRTDCGRGDGAYASEALRRAVTSTVCVARLRDAASPPATPRC